MEQRRNQGGATGAQPFMYTPVQEIIIEKENLIKKIGIFKASFLLVIFGLVEKQEIIKRKTKKFRKYFWKVYNARFSYLQILFI